MNPRDPLDELLDHWQSPSLVSPTLRTRVQNETAREIPGRSDWFERFTTAFARPSFAAAFISACVLLGLFLAESRISHLHAAFGAQVARNYVQLIDPLVVAPPPAPSATKGTP